MNVATPAREAVATRRGRRDREREPTSYHQTIVLTHTEKTSFRTRMAPLLRSQSGAHRVEGADIPHGVVSGELKVQCIVLSDTTSTATQDSEKTLLSCIFGSRLQFIRITDPGREPGSTIHGDGANRVPHGTTFELVTSRELDGGKTFWGGTTKIVHWVVETKGSRPNGELPPIHNLEDLLGEYAHFSALTPRKAVARLEP